MVHGVRRGRTRTSAAASLLLLVALAGCTAQDGSDAAPSSARRAGPGTTPQPPGRAEPALTGVRRALSVQDARSALPTAADLGDRWRVDPDRWISGWLRDDFGPDVEISSGLCRSLLDDIGGLDQFRGEPVQEAADFVTGDDEYYGVEIISSKSRMSDRMFDSFDLRAEGCPTGTVVWPDETRMDFRVTTERGGLGDDSRTLTLVQDWGGYAEDSLQLHVVRVGHTVVTVGSLAGLDDVSQEELSGRAARVLEALG